jgi:hypothetical protein
MTGNRTSAGQALDTSKDIEESLTEEIPFQPTACNYPGCKEPGPFTRYSLFKQAPLFRTSQTQILTRSKGPHRPPQPALQMLPPILQN